MVDEVDRSGGSLSDRVCDVRSQQGPPCFSLFALLSPALRQHRL